VLRACAPGRQVEKAEQEKEGAIIRAQGEARAPAAALPAHPLAAWAVWVLALERVHTGSHACWVTPRLADGRSAGDLPGHALQACLSRRLPLWAAGRRGRGG